MLYYFDNVMSKSSMAILYSEVPNGMNSSIIFLLYPNSFFIAKRKEDISKVVKNDNAMIKSDDEDYENYYSLCELAGFQEKIMVSIFKFMKFLLLYYIHISYRVPQFELIT